MIKSKPAIALTIADLLSAIASEQKFCDHLIDASNIQLQAATRNPVEAEFEALDRICDAIAQSNRVLTRLNLQVLELQVGRSREQPHISQMA